MCHLSDDYKPLKEPDYTALAYKERDELRKQVKEEAERLKRWQNYIINQQYITLADEIIVRRNELERGK